jgi:hypothetical protein
MDKIMLEAAYFVIAGAFIGSMIGLALVMMFG